MPAAPAGRAVLPPRGTAGSLALTRHPARLHAWLQRPARQPAAAPLGASRPRAAADPRAWDDAAYWAFADRLQDHLDRTGAATSTSPARSMLQRQHAADARRGGAGRAHRPGAPGRPGAGARRRAVRTGRRGSQQPADGSQGHSPGWRDGLRGGGIQHLVVDTEIAWALSIAWRAREALGLDQATADLIADRIIRTTAGAFWRWPALRLNQVNWYARMYAAAAAVGGAGERAARAAAAAAAALRRRRLAPDGGRDDLEPRARAIASTTSRRPSEGHKYNLDSAEYANIVCGFLVAYQQARDAGHAAAGPGARAAVVRAWFERVLCGLLDARRLPELGHRPGLQALAPGQEARALARPRCSGSPAAPSSPAARRRLGQAHARPLLRALRPLDGARPRPAARERVRRAVDRRQRVLARVLAAARVQANAAQAVLFGLGEMKPARSRRRCTPTTPTSAASRSPRPPTTPRSWPSTAARSRTAGSSSRGCSTAEQDVAGGVGGRPPASFGVVVRDGSADRRSLAARAWRRPTTSRCGCSRRRAARRANPQTIRTARSPARSRRCACRAPRAAAALEIRTTHTLQGRPTSRPSGASTGASGKTDRGPLPELGHGPGDSARDAVRRAPLRRAQAGA